MKFIRALINYVDCFHRVANTTRRFIGSTTEILVLSFKMRLIMKFCSATRKKARSSGVMAAAATREVAYKIPFIKIMRIFEEFGFN